MEWVIALLALTAMEIVLGIDNIVFITIVSSKLPKAQQPLARKLGLALALITRLALLVTLYWVVNADGLEFPVFHLTDIGVPQGFVEKMTAVTSEGHFEIDPEVLGQINANHFDAANGVSWKDIVLFLGGLFLVGKSVYEIHDEFGASGEHEVAPTKKLFVGVLIQIALLDIVFSLDSVITAVGMVDNIQVMIAAIIIAVVVMMVFAEPVSRFVESHPTLKVLALSFLILIGVMLIAEGVGAHMDKGYIYFAMFFALIVEVLNISLRGKHPEQQVVPPSAD